MPLIKLNATQGLTGTLPAVSGANLTNVSAGKVLQVVTFNNDTAETTTNTSFTGSAKRLSITPSATSSKILIIYSGTSRHNNNSSHCTFTLYRETTSTNLGDSTDGMNQIYNYGGSGYAQLSINYLDSPSTTSAVEYRVYFKSQAGGTEAGIGGGSARSVLTLMEIEG